MAIPKYDFDPICTKCLNTLAAVAENPQAIDAMSSQVILVLTNTVSRVAYALAQAMDRIEALEKAEMHPEEGAKDGEQAETPLTPNDREDRR